MSKVATRALGALSSGLLFGAGLVLSGMTEPRKVLAFLDPFGAWDPSLAFVMLGAISVHAATLWLTRRRSAPLAAERFSTVPTARVDARLLLGSGLFGVGWGLAGYCPGPSVVSLPVGSAKVLVFVASLLAGSALASLLADARGVRLLRAREAPGELTRPQGL